MYKHDYMVPHCMPAITPSSSTSLQFLTKVQIINKGNETPNSSIMNTQIYIPFIAIALSHCEVNKGIWLVTKSLNITIYLVTRFYEFDQKWALFFVSVCV